MIVHRELLPLLARIPPEHFHDEEYRALRVHLVDGDSALRRDARPARRARYWAQEEEIDKATAEIYLLRMTEREVQTELRQRRTNGCRS